MWAPNQDDIDPERPFEKIHSDILLVVHRACHSLGRHPRRMEFEWIVKQVIILPIDCDYYTLR
jgi:hypothetical protein